jgi:hypothetical protein
MAEKELWYGKNEKDETMGNPQPSPNPIGMDAVQRLNGSGFKDFPWV